MKLGTVLIVGFRSIETMTILFNGNGHKVLVGKNESGKSNILKALSLLSGRVDFENKDRKELHDQDAFVRFVFILGEREIRNIGKEFYKKFPFDEQTRLTKNLTIEAFLKKYASYIVYEIHCNKSGRWAYFLLEESLQANGKWYRVGQGVVNYRSGEMIPTESYVNEEFISNNFNDEEQEALGGRLSPIQIKDIYEFLRDKVSEYVTPNSYIFPVIYWRYNSGEHDLPSYVSRDAFAQNPNSCIPLRNMFLLSGIEEESIHSKISEAKAQGHNKLKSLLDDVNEKTNAYIKKSWKEYNKVKIELRSDGENIVVGIKDSKNIFDFQQRSDGFRRLISFLLLISAEVDENQANNPLILIDEPEAGLHPSSAKDLRDKLIELGKTNTIVYATHSISMIDTENINNNLIVSRNDENTTIETAKEDGTSPAENIYQAIGYSIYETLKQKNILLEGYTDKKILKQFMIGNPWKQYGICYTSRVSNIRNVTPLLDLGSRDYFVLSDADGPAIQQRKIMGDPPYWYTYKDLDSEAVTLEDFYEKDFFQSAAQTVLTEYKISYPADDWFSENDRMASIKGFLHSKKRESEEGIKTIVAKIKERCIGKFAKRNVNQEKLKPMLDRFLEKIERQKNG